MWTSEPNLITLGTGPRLKFVNALKKNQSQEKQNYGLTFRMPFDSVIMPFGMPTKQTGIQTN
jgi:hypothetical protein